ncbi:helix-turn-helix domain-containing protein [Acetobacterium sp.]|uniref:helix-turn-helix domain-containing protein n=1 Tax=Acetobacterium sp. TaxID=1872094 RepID=UPI00359343DA
MSLFTQRIEELIIDSGETVQSLAEMGKINRSTLQRVKSGERLPSKTFFDGMCKALRLSTGEEEELKNILEMETIGQRNYYNRKAIVGLIETIAELTEHTIPFSKEIGLKNGEASERTLTDGMETVRGQNNVLRMVENAIDCEIFASEAPQIRQVIPYDWDVVYDYIFQQMMGSGKNLVLQDIVSFPQNCSKSEADQSLMAFKKLAALSLLDNVDYQSRFYYRSSDEHPVDSGVFPYYLLTADRLITLSKDLATAVVYWEAGLYQVYAGYFSELLENSAPFIHESRDLFEIYALEDALPTKLVMQPIPCFSRYYTDEMIDKQMNRDFPYYEALYAAVIPFYDKFRADNKWMVDVFSLKYLRQFMEDGYIYLPQEMVHPFPAEERLQLIKQLYADMMASERKCFAINEDKLFMNSAVEFSKEDPTLRLILHYHRGDETIFKHLAIHEVNIIHAFDDFFDSLPASDYVLSKAETIAGIEAIIRDYHGTEIAARNESQKS